MSGARITCTLCGAVEPPATPLWRCRCGGPFRLAFDPRLGTARPGTTWPGVWRYRESLPLAAGAAPVTLGEGMTPLIPGRLAGREVLLKCDHLNPTGSWKDRGWTLAVSHLAAIRVPSVVEDSSGNAGASLAAYGARAGIEVTIFAPADAPLPKRRQIEAYGARFVGVEGGRDAVAAACLEAARTSFYAGHAWNPWFLYSVRTLAWEIAEQAGAAPAAVFTPVGQGGILLGLRDGFADLMAAGRIDSMPRLFATQAEACAPVVRGFAEGAASPPVLTPRPTIADAIRTPRPIRYAAVLEALRESGGGGYAVPEDEIRAAHVALARQGVYVEPTSAVAAAGATRWLTEHPETERPVVVILTGHGLKSEVAPAPRPS